MMLKARYSVKDIKDYLNHFLALSLWWGHPGQQHGLFFQFSIFSMRRNKRFSLVSSFLAIVIRQIRSLRANGVRLFHFDDKLSFFSKTDSRLSGRLWIVHSKIVWLFFHILSYKANKSNKKIITNTTLKKRCYSVFTALCSIPLILMYFICNV